MVDQLCEAIETASITNQYVALSVGFLAMSLIHDTVMSLAGATILARGSVQAPESHLAKAVGDIIKTRTDLYRRNKAEA